MLNKKEMTMAKELASELIVVGEKKSKENTIRAINNVKNTLIDVFNQMKNSITEIWEAVNSTEEMEHEVKVHKHNWHVPTSNLRDSQVIFKAPYLPNIRNNI